MLRSHSQASIISCLKARKQPVNYQGINLHSKHQPAKCIRNSKRHNSRRSKAPIVLREVQDSEQVQWSKATSQESQPVCSELWDIWIQMLQLDYNQVQRIIHRHWTVLETTEGETPGLETVKEEDKDKTIETLSGIWKIGRWKKDGMLDGIEARVTCLRFVGHEMSLEGNHYLYGLDERVRTRME
jgi:hypothetical protein